MADQDLQAELERLRAENETLKQKRTPGPVSMKVSEKGAVSVYGLGRFPVTLYQEQWLKLLAMADEIRAFTTFSVGRFPRRSFHEESYAQLVRDLPSHVRFHLEHVAEAAVRTFAPDL